MRKVLIIGFGSIGRRHSNVLTQLGCSVDFVTGQVVEISNYYPTISEAFIHNAYDYVVIANATSLHQQALQVVLSQKFHGSILVEKPLFNHLSVVENKDNIPIYVGYNLRFHPIIQRLKDLMKYEEIISFSARVGQYLPTWRATVDYRHNYSAQESMGGGVLRDLSHELDYCLWICGDCLELTALGGKLSELEIDSDDTYSILMRCQNAPLVMINMDYLSRVKRREIIIQTKKHTFFADLIKNQLTIDENVHQFETIDTYEQEHHAILSNNVSDLCTYIQGMKLVGLIDIIESANKNRQWICI